MTIECMNLHMIFNVDMDMHMIEWSVKLRMNMNVDMSIHMIIEWNVAHSHALMHIHTHAQWTIACQSHRADFFEHTHSHAALSWRA